MSLFKWLDNQIPVDRKIAQMGDIIKMLIDQPIDDDVRNGKSISNYMVTSQYWPH